MLVKALEEIGNKIGIIAALFAGWLFMEVQDLSGRTEKLEKKIEAISEIKADLSAIKGQLDLIIKLNVNKENQ